MINIGEVLLKLWNTSGFAALSAGFITDGGWQNLVMIAIACVLLYLGIVKQFEPLLMVGIAFDCLLSNLPMGGLYNQDLWTAFMDPASEAYHSYGAILREGGLLDFFYIGVKTSIYPCLIFMGVGAMTDFGPLLSNPKSLLLGAAAQGGVAMTFLCAVGLGFTKGQAAAIGIIGGADGPTSIFLASKMAPELLGAIAVAAYTYMALVPLIQPPFMKLCTTEAQRKIKMKSLRQVSKGEKLFFCFVVTLTTILLCPDAAPLLGMLMLGNFLRECQVTERLVSCAQNELMNITTIMLGVSVGLTMQGARFLQPQTLMIILLGVVAFAVATVCGLVCAQLMNLVPGWRKNPINPLIGSAGVSAVPMAARVSHNVGQQADRTNFLLMHAMGPNVAGVIGTAVIAGYYITTLSGH
jgi:oxaloacetate decarboxylase beta subunit